jgi:hypothetical protein
LTIEIQRLKEELKRYKQLGPDLLKKEKLFEIKVHGLPKRKKRELEATLREFAASLEGSPSAEASSQRKKSRHANRLYSASGSISKHASSSSGSHSRPVDSAYASMSTGPNSSGTSLGVQSARSRARVSEQKVENYLKDIPEGLYPRHMMLTDKEKKKLVVRRLEQLFTGKISSQRTQLEPAQALLVTRAGAVPTPASGSSSGNMRVVEPAREAQMLPSDESHRKSRSRDNGSASNSNGDQTESGGNGSGTNATPPNLPPEQRPTRPRDLDPDRVQIPSENMSYIRHLGLVPPELLSASASVQPVSTDADGWVYLNLLCNLAQLHIVNVTPDFIRAAVSEKSTKFQLSPDGRKIRWRGGSDGTKFSSDSSGDNSQSSPMTDDTDTSNQPGSQRKRQKQLAGQDVKSALSSKNPSKFGPQLSGSSESFHYKPLFVHQNSSLEQTSLDDTMSSLGAGEDSNIDSRWGFSGSSSSRRKKHRLDGAIIYYSGAPFCTDLSGDPGDISPTAYMVSAGQDQKPAGSSRSTAEAATAAAVRDVLHRTSSGSSLPYRPLNKHIRPDDSSLPELITDDTDSSSDLEMETPWSDGPQYMVPCRLEPCGLGGVMPSDHFIVGVQTKRWKLKEIAASQTRQFKPEEMTDSIISRLALISTSFPAPMGSSSRSSTPAVEIEYISGRIKRLDPRPLPPAATFVPPFSSDSSLGSSDDLGSDADVSPMESSEELMSRRANPHNSDNTYPDDADITSADEEGADPDEEEEFAASQVRSSRPKAADNSSDSDHGVMRMQRLRESRRYSAESAAAAVGTSEGEE